MIKFVSQKTPDLSRIQALLDECAAENHWANCGPLYRRLTSAYARHFGLKADRAVVPCANAGIALEAMARLLAGRAGRPLRWVGSAFSFQNLGRGYFADMAFVDCAADGLLDLDALRHMDPESYDGLVVVNPFGHFRDFGPYIRFAQETGKQLLLDNAAGVDKTLPDWPWQALSLHHTKPYGVGEGGLAIVPADEAAPFYALLNYGSAPAQAGNWLNNGKISDISCAFLLDRLEKAESWRPRFFEQAARVAAVAGALGLKPLRPMADAPPAMSWAFVSPKPIALERVAASTELVFGKYYKPLTPLPQAVALYAHLVNIPTHPDVAQLSDAALGAVIEAIL